jgi:hypothetical protein
MVEPALMMKTALVLLTLAALGGLAMAGIRLSRNVNPPHAFAMGHGLLAGAALTLLLYAYFTVGMPTMACWALVLLVVAALGGTFLNLGFHMKGTLLPKGMMMGHAAIAVVGYGLLAVTVLGGR